MSLLLCCFVCVLMMFFDLALADRGRVGRRSGDEW